MAPSSPILKPAGPGYGAFVLSLDFELHWGVRDHERADGAYRQNLFGARKAIPRLLETFDRYEIAVTWATVGFLFARSLEERRKFEPSCRPSYVQGSLDPYGEAVGTCEDDDPLHYAPSLIEQICQYPRQEIATHTFCHYYCCEPGQTLEQFAADLKSAKAIAADRGLELRSIVFPRNQVKAEYKHALLDSGITCYRGSEFGWMHRSVGQKENTLALRLARLGDSYLDLSGSRIVRWGEVLEPEGLCNVRASRFLRPYRPNLRRLEEKRLRRITEQVKRAALEDGIFHLWFHPHNFGLHLEENLTVLETILQVFRECRGRYGMRSLSMGAVADIARTEFATLPGKQIPPAVNKESVPA